MPRNVHYWYEPSVQYTQVGSKSVCQHNLWWTIWRMDPNLVRPWECWWTYIQTHRLYYRLLQWMEIKVMIFVFLMRPYPMHPYWHLKLKKETLWNGDLILTMGWADVQPAKSEWYTQNHLQCWSQQPNMLVCSHSIFCSFQHYCKSPLVATMYLLMLACLKTLPVVMDTFLKKYWFICTHELNDLTFYWHVTWGSLSYVNKLSGLK